MLSPLWRKFNGFIYKPDCLSTLNSYLYHHTNVKLIIHALPHDFLPVKEFVTALNAVGKESVLLDLPQVALEKIRRLSGFPAIQNPISSKSNKNNHPNSAIQDLKDVAAVTFNHSRVVKVILIALLLSTTVF